MTEIRVHAVAAAPLTTTWSVLADQAGMSTCAPGSTELEQVGVPPPDGVGAIRVVSQGPLRVREQLFAVDAPTLLGYRLLSGLPLHDYVGETALTTTGSGITWTVSFRTRFPGLTFAVRRAVRALAAGLAKEAERVAHQHTGGTRFPSEPCPCHHCHPTRASQGLHAVGGPICCAIAPEPSVA